jgi:hypothetical protein
MIVAGIAAAIGAIVGAFVTWSIGASVAMPGWLVGLLVAVTVASSAIAFLVWRRMTDMKSMRFDPSDHHYYAASRNAITPGPFCRLCWEVDGRQVSLVEGDYGMFCEKCKDYR